MSKLRISVVQYLNTAPLVRGFTHGALQGKYDLSFTVPSQCAEALRNGAADIAIIPAIEYQRIAAQGRPLRILPDLAIASKERVRSLLVISKVPIRQARRIALDPSSRSTQALVKILSAKRWKISPEFVDAGPMGHEGENIDAILARSDAALIIGDAALRLAIAAEAQGARCGHDGQWRASGEVADAHAQLYFYDVVEEWRRMTGLPAVLALWAVRGEIISPEVVADFLASRDFGLSQIAEIASETSREMNLPEKELRFYLEKNIDYSLDADNIAGLQAFFRESETLELIGPLQTISIADGATASRLS